MSDQLIDFIHIVDAKLTRIEVELKGVRKDIRYDGRRLTKLEDAVEPLERDLFRFKVVGGFVVSLGVVLIGAIGWLIKILVDLKVIS